MGGREEHSTERYEAPCRLPIWRKWHPAQHVVTESLSGAIVTQKIVCHGPSHPKLPQPSPGKHTGVAEFIFNGELTPTAGSPTQTCATCQVQDLADLVSMCSSVYTLP